MHYTWFDIAIPASLPYPRPKKAGDKRRSSTLISGRLFLFERPARGCLWLHA